LRNCGNTLTGSASRSKNGKKHFYYHCNHCGVVRLPADEVHHRVDKIIDEIKIKKTSKMVFEVIMKNNVADTKLRKKSTEKIEQEIKLFEGRIKATEDKLADGQITSSTFNNIVNRYKSDIAKLQHQRDVDKDNNSEQSLYLKKGIDFVSNLQAYYNSTEVPNKRKVLSSIFPEKLYFSKKNSRTPRINQAIPLILTDKGLAGNKKDNSSKM
jgi:site-specific DNA recombinase